MAARIKAIKALKPRIELARTAGRRDLTEMMMARTGLNEGETLLVQYELRDVLLYFARMGRPVKVEGLGTFTPAVGADGSFHLNFRAEVALKRALNEPGKFWGQLANSKNIGKSADELAAQWNELHPDDPVTD